MMLDLAACEYMKLDIATEPSTIPTDWEASIDGGATWVAAIDLAGAAAWLVAGPDYDGSETAPFITTQGETPVKVRLIDNPETVIRGAPGITTTSL